MAEFGGTAPFTLTLSTVAPRRDSAVTATPKFFGTSSFQEVGWV